MTFDELDWLFPIQRSPNWLTVDFNRVLISLRRGGIRLFDRFKIERHDSNREFTSLQGVKLTEAELRWKERVH